VDTAGLDGIERLYVAAPLEFRGQRTGSRVTLGIPLGPYRTVMNASLRRNLGILAIGTVVCFLMAWLVGKVLFLREVRPIPATARRISRGDLVLRLNRGTRVRADGTRFARFRQRCIWVLTTEGALPP
jgi:hypothetical protein